MGRREVAKALAQLAGEQAALKYTPKKKSALIQYFRWTLSSDNFEAFTFYFLDSGP